MALEIEAKLKVDSLEPVRQKLIELGAKPENDVLQQDYYFDNSAGTLENSDSALRLRYQEQAGNRKIVLSYKGPKQGGKFKMREELQACVDSLENTIEILSRLGYNKSLVIEKKRQPWILNGCEVSLDQVPVLGFYVEIEGPGEEVIELVQKQLGLDDREHIVQGYASLIFEWCRSTGSEQIEFRF